MSAESFAKICKGIRPYTEFVYLHVMGEPLSHPQLKEILDEAFKNDLRVIITTNGTLLKKREELLLSHEAVHKINVSLHAFEANDIGRSIDGYIDDCTSFGKKAEGRRIVCYRLWNEGGANGLNEKIVKKLKEAFGQFVPERKGVRLADKVYLESDSKFDWPSPDGPERSAVFCYGLRDHIAILCDGTVVPCCLDNNGTVALGNIFESQLSEIIEGIRAQNIYNGFSNGVAVESLCKGCGYAERFKRKGSV